MAMRRKPKETWTAQLPTSPKPSNSNRIYAVAYYYRGVAKQAKGDSDGAIADYTKAIELKPDFAMAYYNRGLAKGAKGDLDGANADHTKAIEIWNMNFRKNKWTAAIFHDIWRTGASG